jgi:hypothetical protein
MTRDGTHRPQTTAQGSETLLDVLTEAADGGYDTQFIVREDGLVLCARCDSANPAATFDIVHFRRLEGASDPADMLIVVWSACPTCRAHGTLTLGFGPNASAADATVLAVLDLRDADASPAAPRVSPSDPGSGRTRNEIHDA